MRIKNLVEIGKNTKLKSVVFDKLTIKKLVEIDKTYLINLVEIDKSTIFALYINDYGERNDIVQAQDV